MTDTNAGGWPDADKPGVPLNPDRDGWHWLQCENGPPEAHAWSYGNWESGGCGVPLVRNPCWRYLGPCLTPSDLAAREAAAAAAMREMAADALQKSANHHGELAYDAREARRGNEASEHTLLSDGYDMHAAAIRALPLPAAAQAALDAVVAKAEIEGAANAMAQLQKARPDVAALLRGEAVAVPREATEAMLDAYWRQAGESREMRPRVHVSARRYYRTMLAASPWAQEEKRDE